MPDVRPLSPLLRELIEASRYARRPEFAPALAEAGLGFCERPVWGFAHIRAKAGTYHPDPDGELAVITGAYEDLRLVDLVATSLTTRAMSRRNGNARLLGFDTVAAARERGHPLCLFENALGWLRARCRGAVVLDWGSVRPLLDELPSLRCQTAGLALRLRHAFERPLPYPELFVPRPKERDHA